MVTSPYEYMYSVYEQDLIKSIINLKSFSLSIDVHVKEHIIYITGKIQY